MTQLNGTLSLNGLIALQREEHSMPQEFYTDAEVHSEDLERIFSTAMSVRGTLVLNKGHRQIFYGHHWGRSPDNYSWR